MVVYQNLYLELPASFSRS